MDTDLLLDEGVLHLVAHCWVPGGAGDSARLGQGPEHGQLLGQGPEHGQLLRQGPEHGQLLGQGPEHGQLLGQGPEHEQLLGQGPEHGQLLGQGPEHGQLLGQGPMIKKGPEHGKQDLFPIFMSLMGGGILLGNGRIGPNKFNIIHALERPPYTLSQLGMS